jgi:sec-independent protein translocase protein TatC
MKVRPIGHEDRLSIVDHLDELRSRLIVCIAVLFVAFGLCYWQNGHLIDALNRALPHKPASQNGLAQQATQSARLQNIFRRIEIGASEMEGALANAHGVPPAAAHGAAQIAAASRTATRVLPQTVPTQVKPITIGVGESFTTTLLVVAYFSLIVSLPVLLYQLYAFVVPALNPSEKRMVVPAMFAAPLLFVAGAAFTYFMVLPPAVRFLQGYNSSDFDILVQAKTYYKFEMFMMIGIGLAFQVPLFLLALQKAGIITARTLTLNWRYAVVLISVIAAALPGVDPVTMMLEMLPLVILYLASIVMLKIVERRDARRAAAAIRRGEGLDISH